MSSRLTISGLALSVTLGALGVGLNACNKQNHGQATDQAAEQMKGGNKKCGQGKCGGDKSCGQKKCGGDHSGDQKGGEKSCGESSCGK